MHRRATKAYLTYAAEFSLHCGDIGNRVYTPRISWASKCAAQENLLPTTSHHPPIVIVDFSNDCAKTFDKVLHGDWSTFDALLSTLPALRKIVFGFKTAEHMSRFNSDVLEIKMAHTGTKFDYQCTLWDHEVRDNIYESRNQFFVSADAERDAGTFPSVQPCYHARPTHSLSARIKTQDAH